MCIRDRTAQLATSAVFDAQGRLWVAYARDGHVYVARSDDAGRSFAPELRVNEVPEAIAADGESRPKLAFAADGGVLVAWTRPLAKPYTGEIRFARAADGRNFAPPFTVHRDRAEITHRFESMVVAGDGRVVDNLVYRLRSKLGQASDTADLIVTVRGFGYRIPT